MSHIGDTLHFITALIFGVFIGALIAEGALLVPYWRTLKAEEFYKLHSNFGPRLFRFYGPLTSIATIFCLINASLSIYMASSKVFLFSMASFGALSMVAIYFYYFHKANAQFALGLLSENELSIQLKSWERWHWIRVSFGLVAFACLLT